MTTMYTQTTASKIVAVFALAMTVLSTIAPAMARADYWSDYGSYYDNSAYGSGYASYDSYDYYSGSGSGSYYYDNAYTYTPAASTYYTGSTYTGSTYDTTAYTGNNYTYSGNYYDSTAGNYYDTTNMYSPYSSQYQSAQYIDEPYHPVYYNGDYPYASSSYSYDSCTSHGCSSGCSTSSCGSTSTCHSSGCNTTPTYTRPNITTKSATDVDEVSAQLQCGVTPNGDTTNVWFVWGTSNGSLSHTTTSKPYSNAATVSQYISGLSGNTTYYYQCVGENSAGKTYGSTLSFRTQQGYQGETPDVQTKTATDVQDYSARLACHVNPKNLNTTTWFEYGETTSMNQTSSRRSIGSEQDVEQYVSGLNNNTGYYYRCVAENEVGKTYGNRQYFSTSGYNNNNNNYNLPSVSTNQPTGVSATSATLNGYVNPQGDNNTERWFEYGPTLSLGYSTNRVRAGYTLGNFSDSVYGLQNNTTYYYRAMARNNAGTSYGNVVSFRTGDGGWMDNRGPVATTGQAENIARTSFDFTGNVSIPSATSSVAWFEWGSTQSLGRSTAAQTVGGYSSSVRQSQFGLDYNTTYYYRLVVQNAYGISRGAIMSATTLAAPASEPVKHVAPVVSGKQYGAHIVKSVENLDAKNGTQTDVFAEKGQKVRYTIEVENSGDYAIKEVRIKDLVPFYLEFANAENTVSYDSTRREVVWYIDELRPNETRTVSIDMVVTDDARVGMSIENVARLESAKVTETSNSVFIRVSDNVEEDARLNHARTGAAALFFGDGGFFPSTLLGWLVLLILVLIIVMLIRYGVVAYNEAKAKKAAKAAQQATYPQALYAMPMPPAGGMQNPPQPQYPQYPQYPQPPQYPPQGMPPHGV